MRPTISQTMMAIAVCLSQRATCKKRAVGAVLITEGGHIVGTGYNGVPSKMRHCTSFPCREGICNGLHAEINAIAHCHDIGAAHTCIVTTFPCWHCTKALAATPIQHIIYGDRETLTPEALNYWYDLGRTAEYLDTQGLL